MPHPLDNENFRRILFAYPSKAIRFLYTMYYDQLIGVSMMYTGYREASEDIVQETIIYVWENHEKLGRYFDKPLENYLIRVVRNKSVSYYRKYKKTDADHEPFSIEVPVAIAYSAEAHLIAYETSKEIMDLMASFPARERECLLMSLNEEMTTRQIADKLGVTVKAVERSITSANKRLKKYWKTSKD